MESQFDGRKISDLMNELEAEKAANIRLQTQLDEVLYKFKDVKTKAEHRGELLHHVMSEYASLEKEYEIMKSASISIQKKTQMLQEEFTLAESKVEQMEQTIQMLEVENNELRRNRVIEPSSKAWYGICTHSCATHPRSYPNLHAQRHPEVSKTRTDDGTLISCDTCTEAEKWAEEMYQNTVRLESSQKREQEATLPIRVRIGRQSVNRDDSFLKSTSKNFESTLPTQVSVGRLSAERNVPILNSTTEHVEFKKTDFKQMNTTEGTNYSTGQYRIREFRNAPTKDT